MAGSISASTATRWSGGRMLTTYTFAVTSDGAGAVNSVNVGLVSGRLSRVVVLPGTGADQPLDDFDVTLLDSASDDVLSGQGTNCDQTEGTQIIFDPPLDLEGGAYQPTFAAMGAANTAVMVMEIQQ